MAKQTRLIFAEKLKSIRKDKKMTQTELANLAGISVMTIKRYEAGDSFPDMGILGSLCVALKDDRLLESWAETEVKGVYALKDVVFEKVKDIAYRKFWNDIVNNGSWPFQKSLAQIGQSFQNMNALGIQEIIKIAEVLSNAPEYQAKEEWAYRKDSLREEDVNGERETESE